MSYFQDSGAVGCFRHRETRCTFEYRPTADEWALDRGFPFEVAVGDTIGYPYRFARILETVAYVAVDEDEFGKPVVERWPIKHEWRR